MRFIVVLALLAFGSVASAQDAREYAKPNLGETNLREPPKTPNSSAGNASDYLLISSDFIGADRYLRFDIPVREVKVDDPTVLMASVGPTDEFTLILRPKSVGQTRVLVFGAAGSEFATLKRLIYDANIAVGSRIVTYRDRGVREVMDCAPACYPSPTDKPREPDQIIEYRSGGGSVVVGGATAPR